MQVFLDSTNQEKKEEKRKEKKNRAEDEKGQVGTMFDVVWMAGCWWRCTQWSHTAVILFKVKTYHE